MQDSDIAVVAFFFNRPKETNQCLKGIERSVAARKCNVVLICDGYDGRDIAIRAKHQQVQNELREYENRLGWKFICNTSNLGMKKNIIQSLTDVLSHYDAAIVIEDDIVISENCIEYFFIALNKYEGIKNMFGIAGTSFLNAQESASMPDSYFLPIATSWCWATYADRWNESKFDANYLHDMVSTNKAEFDFGGYPYFKTLELDKSGEQPSWAIEFYANQFLNDGLFLFPKHSLAKNIGQGGDSTNQDEYDPFVLDDLNESFIPVDFPEEVTQSENVILTVKESFKRKLVFRQRGANLHFRIMQRIKRLLNVG